MNPEELTTTRESLNLSQAELARTLGVSNNTVNRWEAGSRAIPPYLSLALEAVAQRAIARLRPLAGQ